MARYRVTLSFPASNDPPIVREFDFPSEDAFLEARDAAQAWYATRRPANVRLWRLDYERIS